MSNTFFWHDYETWGINPAVDWPSQFAGIRTDWDLNIIDEPVMFYCQPPLERLPHPQACAITGISPQHALQQGVPEPQFCAQIYQQMNRSATCNVGYNSLRFDDEVTRHMLYRNFYPVYDREWRNGNSRWDIIDVARLCYAIRPTGIEWPLNEQGLPSFKLEALSTANHLDHQQAHDALSDVYATIALAKLIKEKKPRLFDYALQLRDKQQVLKQIDLHTRKPLLYISAYFSAAHANASLVMPLAMHPDNKNALIVADLRRCPQALLDASVDQLIENLYAPAERRTIDLPLMSLQINRSPMLASASVVDDRVAQHINIDREQCWQHYQLLLKSIRHELDDKLQRVFCSRSSDHQPPLAEQQLYSGGFFNNRDVAQLDDVRLATTEHWQQGLSDFEDPRLNTLKSLYQRRHCHQSLTKHERNHWLQYALNNIITPSSDLELSLDDYLAQLDSIEQPQMQQALRDWPAQREQLLRERYS